MQDRLARAASAVARLVLVVVAFGLAVGSIAVSSVRGFCPGEDEQALAMGGGMVLATIVEEPTVELEGTGPADGDAGAPAEGTEAPADDTGEDVGEGDGTDEGGACPGGVSRCLPPLFSSVLLLGDPVCNEEAPARLRGTLVPAFVGATVLLAGAWWLRPSRLHRGADEPVG